MGRTEREPDSIYRCKTLSGEPPPRYRLTPDPDPDPPASPLTHHHRARSPRPAILQLPTPRSQLGSTRMQHLRHSSSRPHPSLGILPLEKYGILLFPPRNRRLIAPFQQLRH